MNKWILGIRILIVFSVLFLNLLGGAIAEDCQECGPVTPSSAGNIDYPDEWECDPSIHTDPLEFDDENTEDTIAAGGSITIYITGGVPPYTFSTSSTGYTFNGGVQTLETDSTSVTLSCASGVCGTAYDVYATLNVTDCCEDQETIVIRNTAGHYIKMGGGSSGSNCTISETFTGYYYRGAARLIVTINVCSSTTKIYGDSSDGSAVPCLLAKTDCDISPTCDDYFTTEDLQDIWNEAIADSGFQLIRCRYSNGNFNTAHRTSCILNEYGPNVSVSWKCYYWGCQ